MNSTSKPQLRPYQAEFLNSFLKRNDERTLLVAAPGTGKSLTTQLAATKMLIEGLVDQVLFVAGPRALAAQWRSTLPRSDDWWSHNATEATVKVTTYSALIHDPKRIWENVPTATRWLLIFEGVERAANHLEAIVAEALVRFPGSRVLFIGADVAPPDVDARFEFNLEFFDRDVLGKSVTQSKLTQLAPSIGLLQKVQRKLITLEKLNWREFEQLIAQMLETDGYEVELMRGSKDGGIDVVATKDLAGAGLFKSVWQAKKNRLDRKVGLSLVRELADTRLEHGASKAIIVTTSYLTSGALDRVERDRFLLGKVDRADLNQWIERTLRRG